MCGFGDAVFECGEIFANCETFFEEDESEFELAHGEEGFGFCKDGTSVLWLVFENGIDVKKCGFRVADLNVTIGAIDEDVHPETIAEYLHNSHEYFLKYRLPALRERLEKAMDRKHEAEVSEAVMRFFDEYVSEVEKHMMYEEEVVFPYVRALVEGASGGDYRISVFRKRHDQIESRLTELRDILVKYYRGKNGYAFNAALFDIFTCAEDLREHNQVEDALLVPLIEKLERKTVCGKS